MNDRTGSARCAPATQLTLALLCLLGTAHANANTYFKCVDAKGAVTVQQTACVTSSSQEEKKVWVSGAQAPPRAASVTERSSPVQRPGDDTAKPKDR